MIWKTVRITTDSIYRLWTRYNYTSCSGRGYRMGVVSTPLLDEARSIFADLGYTISEAGSELRAERKWRIVYVTASGPDEIPDRGELRCFVTRDDRASALCDDLLSRAPEYDWAVMGLDDGGEYQVYHPNASQGLPT